MRTGDVELGRDMHTVEAGEAILVPGGGPTPLMEQERFPMSLVMLKRA